MCRYALKTINWENVQLQLVLEVDEITLIIFVL